MILAVDIGNTNVVVCGAEEDDILFESRMITDSGKSSSEYGAQLQVILADQGMDPQKIEGSIISSVVPSVQDTIREALEKLTGRAPLVVGPGLQTGMEIRIDNPAEVGADLIVGCAAALRQHEPPLIVIDMGTATTMFALDQSGAFVGGCIAPGVKISMDALTGRTALLPEMEVGRVSKAIGTNTMDCMHSGILMGTACMLDGMVRRMEEELGGKATVFVTGGIAPLVIPMCRTPMIYDKNLLIKGLVMLYRQNISG